MRSRYWPSLRSTVWLDQIEAGLTQASSVSWFAGFSAEDEGTRTWPLEPFKATAVPVSAAIAPRSPRR